MTKKFVSMFLALAMCLALAAPAFATTPPDDESEYDEIVVFSDTVQAGGIQPLNDLTDEERIQQAREGVLALGLEEMGLGYIEEACLSELDTYVNEENIILEEYIVLIPKARAASLTYYAKCRGYDFYRADTSKSTVIHRQEKFAQYPGLIDLSMATANIAMCFVSEPVFTISWALLTSLSSFGPTGGRVYSGDFVDCFARIYPKNEAFYIKEGSTYALVYNREYGSADPYTVYHYIQPEDKAHPTETVTYDPVDFPNLSDSGRRDVYLSMMVGFYEEQEPVMTWTIASHLNYEWIK